MCMDLVTPDAATVIADEQVFALNAPVGMAVVPPATEAPVLLSGTPRAVTAGEIRDESSVGCCAFRDREGNPGSGHLRKNRLFAFKRIRDKTK